MLDEKNDNLPENEQMADGQLSNVDTTAETATTTAPEEDETVTIAEAELGDESRLNVEKQQQAVIDIENSNAEESEDETLKDRHNIPMEDYEALSMGELVSSLEKLVEVEKTMSVKEHVEELKKSFLSKYNHFIEEKKEQFTEENPESTEDFRYDFPLKHTFDKLYSSYREKKNTHFKSLQNNLASNLETRLAIVEELKELIKPCLITSYDIENRRAKLFNSWDAHLSTDNFYVKDVCRATSAAPTYFSPVQIKSMYGQIFSLIDGGMYANNPALCAYAEARKIPFAEVLKNHQKANYPAVNDMMIISIGNGIEAKSYSFKKMEKAF